jgi:hypothetical protein
MLPLGGCIIQPGWFADERLILSGKFDPVRDASNHCHLARRKDDRAAIRTATRLSARSPAGWIVRLTLAIVRAWTTAPRSTRRNARSARIRISAAVPMACRDAQATRSH